MTREKARDAIIHAITAEQKLAVIDAVFDELDKKFNFIEQYKFSDKCPDYKTVEQFDMFIRARETDIYNVQKAINEAKRKKWDLEKCSKY